MAEVVVHADAEAIGSALAAEIAQRHDRPSGPFLLGCPGGRSLRTTYAALARGPRLPRLVVVMMDEYVGAPADAHHSCTRFAHDEIAAPLGVPPERVWLPDPSEPEAYDDRIVDAGGIDLFLLASGASDGHVAFCPPGSPRDGRTAVLELAESTRRDNLATFPRSGRSRRCRCEEYRSGSGRSWPRGRFASCCTARTSATPRDGCSRRTGSTREWPSSIVHEHEDAKILIDEEALP